MIKCTEKEKSFNVYSFIASNDDEITKLPTTKTKGQDNLSIYRSVGHGSTCLCISTGNLYILDGETDIWTKL